MFILIDSRKLTHSPWTETLQQKPLDDAKLSQYASGKVRKSKREKELEAAEAKRKEEEESAAKAYAEFLDTFEGGGGGESSRRAGSAFVRADTKTAYNPTAAVQKNPKPSTGAFFKRVRVGIPPTRSLN